MLRTPALTAKSPVWTTAISTSLNWILSQAPCRRRRGDEEEEGEDERSGGAAEEVLHASIGWCEYGFMQILPHFCSDTTDFEDF